MIKYYPFELHTHTVHSDGDLTVEQLIAYAKQRNLTGIAKTDHNTASGNRKFALEARLNGLVPIEGYEITNHEKGDATILGGNGPDYAEEFFLPQERFDFTNVFPTDLFPTVASSAINAGSSVGYAHPLRYPPARTLQNLSIEKNEENIKLTHIEVFNSINIERQPQYQDASSLYYWLLMRRPVAAVAGSDLHRLTLLGVNYPITFLGIDGEPSTQKAIDAVLNRRTYIAYGWQIDDENNDQLLNLLGGNFSGEIEWNLTIKKIPPPLTGNNYLRIDPQSAEIVAFGNGTQTVISSSLFKLSQDKMTADTKLKATLLPNTRIILRVCGICDGVIINLIITSPIEVTD